VLFALGTKDEWRVVCSDEAKVRCAAANKLRIWEFHKNCGSRLYLILNGELCCIYSLLFRTQIQYHHSSYTPTTNTLVTDYMSGFGGLGVVCWPLLPKFAGSHPAEAVGFLGRKNPQHVFLRRGSKAVGRSVTACKISLNDVTWKLAY